MKLSPCKIVCIVQMQNMVLISQKQLRQIMYSCIKGVFLFYILVAFVLLCNTCMPVLDRSTNQDINK